MTGRRMLHWRNGLREREAIEARLGYAIPTEAAGSVQSFYDLSPKQLDELRAVATIGGGLETLALLGYYMGDRENIDDLWTFKSEVIDDGNPLADWHKEPRLCCVRFDSLTTLCQGEDALLGPLGDLDGLRWFHYPPKASHQLDFAAPGVLVSDTDFYFEGPADCITLRLSADGTDPQQIDDLPLAIRRWLAASIAFDGSLAELTPDDDRLSDHARAALIGLARERKECWPSDQPDIPLGYRGPDEWYR